MAVTAKQMVDKLLTALQQNPAGVISISIDGQTAQYSRAQAIQELQFWEKRLARDTGSRPRTASIDLSKGFSGL